MQTDRSKANTKYRFRASLIMHCISVLEMFTRTLTSSTTQKKGKHVILKWFIYFSCFYFFSAFSFFCLDLTSAIISAGRTILTFTLGGRLWFILFLRNKLR